HRASRHLRDLHSFPTRRSSDLAGGGMIGREAARDARELLAFQSAKELANRRRGEDAAELFVALGDVLADGEQLRRLGHVHAAIRSEEHTSELQSRSDIVCRLLL